MNESSKKNVINKDIIKQFKICFNPFKFIHLIKHLKLYIYVLL